MNGSATMLDQSRKHPRFVHPPVQETVFGIEFTPLQKLQIPYFGLFWEKIRTRYPVFKVVPPLQSVIENLDSTPQVSPNISVSIQSEGLPVRCWFLTDDETRLVQVQQDRFIFNWKRGLIDAPYPHYENIRPVIDQEWSIFRDFVAANGLGMLNVQQCEVTYFNHIEKDTGWTDYSQLRNVLTVWSGTSQDPSLQFPENVNIGIRYRMPEGMGRLHVHAEPVIRIPDYKEVLQLNLLARGKPRSSDPAQVFEWFDFAQRFVSESFVNLTTAEMHSIWGIMENR
jgi:uncharacterized protein (TIGR04255 family)